MSPENVNLEDKNWTVDVIVPVKNGERWIRGLLKSLEEQTWQPNKVILVDDHSALPLASFIKTLSSPLNLKVHTAQGFGVSNARNEGIRISNAEIIAFLDVDDRWNKFKLEEQIKYLKLNLGIQAVYTGCTLQGIDQVVMKYYPTPEHPISTAGIARETTPVVGSASSLAVRAEALLACGYFDTKLDFAEDLDYWIRLSRFTDFGSINKFLTYITFNADSVQRSISQKEKFQKEIVSKILIYSKHADLRKIAALNLQNTLLLAYATRAFNREDFFKYYHVIIKSKILKTPYLVVLFHFAFIWNLKKRLLQKISYELKRKEG